MGEQCVGSITEVFPLCERPRRFDKPQRLGNLQAVSLYKLERNRDLSCFPCGCRGRGECPSFRLITLNLRDRAHRLI